MNSDKLSEMSDEQRTRLKLRDDDLVTVCSACLTACCWLGIFMCQRSKAAGTQQMTVAEIRSLGLEDPSYVYSLRLVEGDTV